MISFYANKNNFLHSIPFEALKKGRYQPIWIDVFNPTVDENLLIEDLFNVTIPNRYKMGEIELSNRLYQKNNIIYVTGNFIDEEQKSQAVTFILANNMVITLRYANFSFFDQYLLHSKNNSFKPLHHASVFMGLLGAAIGQAADYIEEVGHLIDQSTQVIFRPVNSEKRQKTKKVDFNNLIRQIGNNGDLISKIHETLMSSSRILNFVKEAKNFKKTREDLRILKVLMKDIPPLNAHATFLANKLNFLLDACLGIINIEQNTIIKIVSVAALVFFPPTLVASIYGMNFEVFPELKWSLGYPFALLLMLSSGLLPYIYFKQKNWI